MLKVLIVEDDLIIADMIEDRLVMDGLIVCGIATNIQEAMSLATTAFPDAAVVDVRLADGDLGTDLAPRLKLLRQDIGILYSTGNIELVLDQAIGEGCLKKPYDMSQLAPSLHLIINQIRTGRWEGPVPDGLILLNAG